MINSNSVGVAPSKESPETYTLTLSSNTLNPAGNGRPLPFANRNNVTWRVDYDNLFKGRLELFDYCRVRFTLINGSGAYTTNPQQGYLSADFPTNFNAPTTTGCILGIIVPQANPVGTQGVFIVNGQNCIGVDITHKQLTGVQPLTIQWLTTNGTLMSGLVGGVSIELYFELYN